MKILLTGFEPFGGESLNPSFEAVRLLPEAIGSCALIKLELPVEYGRAGEALLGAIRQHSPDAVLCVGQAGGRRGITVERIAVNCRDADAPDNAGVRLRDAPIVEDGEDGLFSTLPVRSIVERLRAESIPAGISNSAGTYVCNDVMYTLLHAQKHDGQAAVGGFIHVPYADIQMPGKREDTPFLTISQMTKALALAAEVIIAVLEGRNDHVCG